MIKKICFIGSVICLFSFSTYLYADGNSGCGWGSMVMKGSKGSSAHSSATSSNNLFGSQMFGITSGTSNCKPDSAVQKDVETKKYLIVNYHNLTEEMSRGEGEYVATYADLLGCSKESHELFGALTKENFNQIVIPAQTPTQLLKNTREMILNHDSLKQFCTI